MDQNKAFLIIIAVVAVWMIYSLLKRRKNQAKMQDGQDMARLKEAVASVLPDEAGYQVLYAHHEDVKYSYRRTTTYYYYYAIAFTEDKFWIIPLKFEKDQIIPLAADLFTKDRIGSVSVNLFKKKDEVNGLNFVLTDKKGENPAAITVDGLNYRSNAYNHVNIDQKADCAKFAQFMTELAGQVAQENQELQKTVTKEDMKNSRTVGIMGIVFSFIPLVGLIISGIGLLFAPKPSQTGGKACTGLIFNIVALILNILFTAVEIILIALG